MPVPPPPAPNRPARVLVKVRVLVLLVIVVEAVRPLNGDEEVARMIAGPVATSPVGPIEVSAEVRKSVPAIAARIEPLPLVLRSELVMLEMAKEVVVDWVLVEFRVTRLVMVEVELLTRIAREVVGAR